MFNAGDRVQIIKGPYKGEFGIIKYSKSSAIYGVHLDNSVTAILFSENDLLNISNQQIGPSKFQLGDKVKTLPAYNMRAGYKEGQIVRRDLTMIDHWIISCTLGNGALAQFSIDESELELVPVLVPTSGTSILQSMKNALAANTNHWTSYSPSQSGTLFALDAGVEATSTKCQKELKEYFGLNQRYNYCVKCGKKESEHE